MSEYAMIQLYTKYIDIFVDQIGRNRRFALALCFQTYLVFQVFTLLFGSTELQRSFRFSSMQLYQHAFEKVMICFFPIESKTRFNSSNWLSFEMNNHACHS